MWTNHIRITVTAVTVNDTLVYQNHYFTLYDYHRDKDSKITLEIDTVVSEIDLKTWGSLIYLEGDKMEKTSFGHLMKIVFVKGILPLAEHFLQGFFSSRGPVHLAYFLRIFEGTIEQIC